VINFSLDIFRWELSQIPPNFVLLLAKLPRNRTSYSLR